MEWVYILYFICFATIVYALKILTLYFNINIYVGKPNVSWSQHAVYKFFDDCKVDLADSSRKKLLEQKCDTFLITYSSDNYKKVSSAIGFFSYDNNTNSNCIRKYIHEGYQIVYFPPLTFALHTSIKYCPRFLLASLKLKILSHMKTYALKNRLCAHPVLELHYGNSIHFIAPLSQQEDYYVPEASMKYIWRQSSLFAVPTKVVSCTSHTKLDGQENGTTCREFSKSKLKSCVPPNKDNKKTIVSNERHNFQPSNKKSKEKVNCVSDISYEQLKAPETDKTVDNQSVDNHVNDELSKFKKPLPCSRRITTSLKHPGSNVKSDRQQDLVMLSDRRSLSSALFLPLSAVRNLFSKTVAMSSRSLSEVPTSTKLWPTEEIINNAVISGCTANGSVNDVSQICDMGITDDFNTVSMSLKKRFSQRQLKLACKQEAYDFVKNRPKYMKTALHLCSVEN